PALGQPRRVPRPGGELPAPGHLHRQRPRADSGHTLGAATATFLNENKSPSRKAGEVDNRGSHFYLALYWAKELAAQTADPDLAKLFEPVATALSQNEEKIAAELLEVQGSPTDIGGYYRPETAKTDAVMRPSATLNEVLATLG